MHVPSRDERKAAIDPPGSPPPPPDRKLQARAEDVPRPRRLLVIEDEVFTRLDLEQQLATAGYDVVGLADTADEAIRLALTEKPDVVIMDIRLRGVRDGIDAALEIRQLLDIPCVFVSANLDQATMQRAAPAQPLGFVPKPFDLARLLAVLKTLQNK